MDIDWRYGDVRAAVEAKVWDVIDCVFDVIKLATALHHRKFDEGYCAVAAEPRHWAAGGPFTAVAKATDNSWHERRVEDVLSASAAARDAILVKTGPRPVRVPAAFETYAADPIPLPQAPTHALRHVAVRPVR